MKVLLIPSAGVLHLEPETSRDRVVLDALVVGYELAGWGRDAANGQILHVQVEVSRQDSDTAPQCFGDPSEY